MSYGGKRKFSIANSSSSSSDDNHHIHAVDSDSESSLSEVAEKFNPRKSFKGKSKKVASAGKKLPKKKWVNHQYSNSEDSDNDDEEDDVSANSEGSGSESEGDDDLTGLYSLLYNKKQSNQESDNDAGSSSDDSDDDDDDDDDIDFVKLQAQKKLQSMRNARALKGFKGGKTLSSTSAIESSSSSDNEDIEKEKTYLPRRRKSSVKFGRRKSNAALPELKFEFHNQDRIREEPEDQTMAQEEEDMGEEINLSPSISNINSTVPFEFEFDNQLMEVPKIKDDELNSDDDYEIDDNELLATIQAENDVDEFLPDLSTSHDYNHQNQLNFSMRPETIAEEANDDDEEDDEDDEENDPFLKEEEKYLVNEFENNGFDEEDEEDESYFDLDSDLSTSKKINNSFKGIGEDKSKPIKTYESNDSGDSEYDEDDFIDLNDFDVPLFQEDEKDELSKSGKKRSKLYKNSDEDDDSYLWNYFFSSDNDSSVDEKEQHQLPRSRSNSKQSRSKHNKQGVDDLFKQIDNDHTFKPKRENDDFFSSNNNYIDESMDEDVDYDSSESTDIDETIPKPNTSGNRQYAGGSKKATEVLSSKTADYRPPVLGSWVTIDSKPFGIIDGLSTRTLQPKQKPSYINQASGQHHQQQQHHHQQQQQAAQYTSHSIPRKSILIPTSSEDSAEMGLDELLNISELDNNDENDAKIWRDFNNHKKIPLGAFRNKSILHNHHQHSDQGEYLNKRRHSNSSVKKPQNTNLNSGNKDKLRRRRQSILEAVNEGYRPTKSGLFSENALADVEELLGDDNDIMALIKGL